MSEVGFELGKRDEELLGVAGLECGSGDGFPGVLWNRAGDLWCSPGH